MTILLTELSKLEVEPLEVIINTPKNKQEINLLNITSTEGVIDNTPVFQGGCLLCCCVCCGCCCCCRDNDNDNDK